VIDAGIETAFAGTRINRENLMLRPFRFGVQCHGAASGREWQEKARTAEALGYAALAVPDHLAFGLAFGPALAAAAAVTTTLRVATFTLANDLRHPPLVAKDAATLDLLSDGRLDLGLGAGWLGKDFHQAGVPFAPPATRVARLAEAIQIIKALFGDDPVTFQGDHYTVVDLNGAPKPVQRPHPPLLIGAGGPRMLALAAREASIVSLVPVALADGTGLSLPDASAAAMDAKLAILRAAAPGRLAGIELNILLQRLIVSDTPDRELEELSREWTPLTPTDLAASPYILAGSPDQLVDALRARRERWGISSVTLFERDMHAFAPIVARLAGT